MAGVGLRLPRRRPPDRPLRGRAPRSTGRAHGRRRWVTSGRRAIYCLAALCVAAFAILESAFLRSDFSYALVAEGSSTDTPTFYKVTARVGHAGRLAAALVDPARAVRERGAVPHAALAARDRALGHRRARRGGRLLPAPDGGLGEPVRHARRPAGRGRGPQPAAAPPGDDDPPADALHGLRRLLDPVRVRHRRADDAPHGRRLDPRHPPLRARSPGPSSAPGSCSARSGRTPSSAGAATGPGTRWRTRR